MENLEEKKMPNHSLPHSEQPPMNPEVKAKWVAALRSGEYKQAFGKLAIGDCCCTMGVLCEIAVQEKIVEKDKYVDLPSEGGMWWKYGNKEGGYGTGVVPHQVVDWANFSSYRTLSWKGEKFSIGILNDYYKLSFSEIANLIEEQL